ncbi:MAG: hypothetical protein COX57_03695 [Alphaproteobacteria bacterium CG_4_10_14_0_2_um_filter_63_37]|nr:MAG: hypothetical protein AUJ55_05990 [Proteobacteria bacterium CG1_02_64_396]PJA25363.1 MAG: hypothetical protein COX57_03695 [Alphaproteobacteria bacterium CG_4_10_14_0_2_um_filter_63_37]
MRLDLFLKFARLFKRRSLAQEVVKDGCVTVNDRVAKPGTPLKVGDRIVITLATRRMELEVAAVAGHQPKKEQAGALFTWVSDARTAPPNELEDDF